MTTEKRTQIGNIVRSSDKSVTPEQTTVMFYADEPYKRGEELTETFYFENTIKKGGSVGVEVICRIRILSCFPLWDRWQTWQVIADELEVLETKLVGAREE